MFSETVGYTETSLYETLSVCLAVVIHNREYTTKADDRLTAVVKVWSYHDVDVIS